MSENEPTHRRRNRDGGVSRSYASEIRALDDLAEEAEKQLAERRKAREEARALRLQQRLQQHEEEQQKLSKEQDEREQEEYKKALEDAKRRVQERKSASVAKQEGKTSEKLLEEGASFADVAEDPKYAADERVQNMVLHFKKLQAALRDALLHQNRLQNQKVKFSFELDILRDSNEELEDKTRSMTLEIKALKDNITDLRHQVSLRDDSIAELKAQIEGDEQNQQEAASSSGTATAGLQDEIDKLRQENESLRNELAASQQQRSAEKTAEAPEAGTDSDDLGFEHEGLDPVVAARMRRYENQVKRAKRQLQEAEDEQDDLRKENRRLQREVRTLSDDKAQLEVKLEAVQNQLTRLREKRRREIIGSADLHVDRKSSDRRRSTLNSLESVDD